MKEQFAWLQEMMEIAREAAANIGGDGTQDYRVRAIVARMNKQYKAAEKIYMQMVKKLFFLNKWDDFMPLRSFFCIISVSFILSSQINETFACALCATREWR